MKRLLLCIGILLLLAGQVLAGTYYVDKRQFGMGRLTSNGTNVSAGNTVTIGTKTYTFASPLTPAEGEVLVGAAYNDSMQNLIDAINHTGTPETQYSCAAANVHVSAGTYDAGNKRFYVTAKVAGGVGRVATTKVAATLTWQAAKLDTGNGASAAQITVPQGDGAFCDLAGPCEVASGSDHTINIVASSGPYYTTDCTSGNGTGYLYTQQNSANTVTWNWNGNAFQFDKNVNDSTYGYEWHQSTAVGKTSWYYLTAAGGANPSLTTVKTCIVDGYWSATSTNLNNVGFTLYGHYLTDNWCWGNYDTLGFNTLYVKWSGGDPTGKSVQVWVNYVNQAYQIRTGYPNANTFVFNDAVIRGGSTSSELTNISTPFKFNRCLFYNSDVSAITFYNSGATGSEANYCKFINCGHDPIYIVGTTTVNFTGDNNYFENTHLALLMASTGIYTVTFKNNSSKNLLAGFIQHDSAASTLVESNNQIHLDPASTHGSQAIAFTTGVRQWTETAASDYPASTDTSLTTSVDPQTVGDGRQTFQTGVKVGKPASMGSPLYQHGVDVSLTTDFAGVSVGATPNIGAYEGYVSSGGGLSPGLGLTGGNRPPWLGK